MSAEYRHPSFWSSLRASLRGEVRDYTSGSLGWAIAFLAVPMVLEVLMQAVFEVADVFFVGRLGHEAVAAVGLVQGMIILVYAVSTGLAMGTTAVVARRIGQRRPREASRAAGQSLLLGVAASLPFSIAGILFADELMRLMGASDSVAEAGWGFCAAMLGGNASIMLLFILNAVFRGAGDAAIAMRVLWLANGLNIVLDPVFIFDWGLGWGITGAAWATILGRGTGIALQLHILLRGKGRIGIAPSDLRPDPAILRRLLGVSSTGVLQYLVSTASWMLLIRIVALFGAAALAGYTIAIRLVIFAILPAWGLGNATATLVGQNLGARQPERAERSAWVTSFCSVGFLALLSALYVWAAPWMLSLFSQDPEVVRIGALCLRIVCASYVFLAFGLVLSQAFNGAGDTWTPTWMNFLAYWIFQVPFAYALSVLAGAGATGVFVAIACSQVLLAMVSIVMFRRGSWKTREV